MAAFFQFFTNTHLGLRSLSQVGFVQRVFLYLFFKFVYPCNSHFAQKATALIAFIAKQMIVLLKPEVGSDLTI